MFHQGCGGSVGVAFVFTLSACAGTRCAIGDWARDNTCQWEREQPSETEIKGEKEGRELAEASEWKIHTVAGPKSPSVFARSPQLQTAGQGWLCCANEMVGTQTHSHTTHTHETQERIVSDVVLSRNHKWAEQESAARHHPSATTGCSGQHPHDFPPLKKPFAVAINPHSFSHCEWSGMQPQSFVSYNNLYVLKLNFMSYLRQPFEYPPHWKKKM